MKERSYVAGVISQFDAMYCREAMKYEWPVDTFLSRCWCACLACDRFSTSFSLEIATMSC